MSRQSSFWPDTDGLPKPRSVIRGAAISECYRYRYRLWRSWDSALRSVLWVMLNPSTADGDFDDPTVRRCIGFSKSWGFGSMVVCNLFSFRATDPLALEGLHVRDIVGPENDRYLLEAARESGMTICAWGANPCRGRDVEVLGMLRAFGELHCLGLTKKGRPLHPLYRPADAKPTLMR